MSEIEMQIAIKKMRDAEMTDAEILEFLKRDGYMGDTLPKLEGITPSVNTEGSTPVITLEGMFHEQNMAEKGITSEAQKVMETAAKLYEAEHRSKK